VYSNDYDWHVVIKVKIILISWLNDDELTWVKEKMSLCLFNLLFQGEGVNEFFQTTLSFLFFLIIKLDHSVPFFGVSSKGGAH